MHSKINLPYNLDNFEPIISKDTMDVHYNTLYNKYVNDYNDTLTKLENARNSNDYTNIKGLTRDLSFNGSGVILHELYFKNIINNKETYPSNELNQNIKDDFKSFENFKNQFKEAAIKIEGSGWCILAYTTPFNKLEILTSEKHQNLTLWGCTPILVLDMWEHSYFLDHKSDRNKYVDDFFNIINFDEVNNRYENIKKSL